jgi:hypothetical protein
VAGGHGDGAEQNGAALAEHPVGEEAAEDRGQVDRGEIGADDRRGERLAVEAAVEGSEAVEEGDAADIFRLQQVVDQIEDEQGLHAVIGEALPRLGEGEVAEAPGMAEEDPVVPVRGDVELGRGFGDGHSLSSGGAARKLAIRGGEGSAFRRRAIIGVGHRF